MSAPTYNWPQQRNVQLSQNFKVNEFRCRCRGANTDCPHSTLQICNNLVNILQRIRNAVGGPVTITSGFRCPNNTAGAPNSYHRNGRAADFVTSRTPQTDAILAQNHRVPGIILYTNQTNFVHVDTRNIPWWASTTNNGNSFITRTTFGGTGTMPASGGCCNAGSNNPIPPAQSPVLGTTPPTQAQIRTIQQTLNSRYNTGLNTDGIFGNLTRTALVRGHQREINNAGGNVTVDGVWGPQTHNATRNLSQAAGSQGNAVWILQAALHCRRYTNTGGLTSVFGAMTNTEVRNFQTRNSLGVDGVAGPRTMQRLLQQL